MNIKAIWHKLFKKKNKTKALMDYKNIISIPTRENFNNNQEMLSLIDKYKKEYLNILTLTQKKYYIGNDIRSKELSTNLNMNISLLISIFMSEDQETLINISIKEKVNCLINQRKLNLYYEKISNLENETNARLVAIMEIYQERKMFLSKNKKNTLLNEVDNLARTLIVYLSQKTAIMRDVNANIEKSIIDYITNNNENLLREEENEIRKRRNKLLKLKKVLPTDIQIRDDLKFILSDIANAERLLEIYAYQNKDKLENLRSSLKEIKETTINDTNKESLLDKIKNIELNYLVFFYYGRKILTEKDLETLYGIKFNILSFSSTGIVDVFDLENADEIEINSYQEIIFQKIQRLVKGENYNVKAFFKEDYMEALLGLKNIFSIDGHFDTEHILKDKYLFNLLLALDNIDGLNLFIKNYKVDKSLYDSLDFYEDYFEWDSISLEAILWLKSIQKKELESRFSQLLSKHFYYNCNEFYHLPEGIKKIKYIRRWDIPNSLSCIIGDNVNNKIIVMPSTLKEFSGELFAECSLKGIYLNEGLEKIDNNALACKSLKRIIIPSTLRNFDLNALDIPNLSSIIFNNYENSIILNNSDLLLYLLEPLIYLENTGTIRENSISDDLLKSQNSGFDDNLKEWLNSNLRISSSIEYECITKLKLKAIFLAIDYQNLISIICREIECKNWFREKIVANLTPNDGIGPYYANMEEIIIKLQELVRIKTNFYNDSLKQKL